MGPLFLNTLKGETGSPRKMKTLFLTLLHRGGDDDVVVVAVVDEEGRISLGRRGFVKGA